MWGFLGRRWRPLLGRKAGIIKPGVPVVVGKVSDSVAAVFDDVAEEVGAPRPLVLWDRDWFLETTGSELVLKTGWFRRKIGRNEGLRGAIQEINAGTAAMAVAAGDFDLSAANVATGIREARLPGRFEQVTVGDRKWILDGAHNVDAMVALVESWVAEFREVETEIVLGMLDGHDPEPVLRSLARVGSVIRLVPINWTRTLNPDDLAEVAHPFFDDVLVHWSVEEAVDAVQGSQVLVTGSFYLLGEVKDVLERG